MFIAGYERTNYVVKLYFTVNKLLLSLEIRKLNEFTLFTCLFVASRGLALPESFLSLKINLILKF